MEPPTVREVIVRLLKEGLCWQAARETTENSCEEGEW